MDILRGEICQAPAPSPVGGGSEGWTYGVKITLNGTTGSTSPSKCLKSNARHKQVSTTGYSPAGGCVDAPIEASGKHLCSESVSVRAGTTRQTNRWLHRVLLFEAISGEWSDFQTPEKVISQLVTRHDILVTL